MVSLKVYTEKMDMQPSAWGVDWTTEALTSVAAKMLTPDAVMCIAGKFNVQNVRCNTPASTIVLRVFPAEGMDFRLPGSGVCATLGDGLRRALAADVFVVETAKKAPAGVYDLSLVGAPKKLYPGPDGGFLFILQTQVDQLRALGPKPTSAEAMYVSYVTDTSETITAVHAFWVPVDTAPAPQAATFALEVDTTADAGTPQKFLLDATKVHRKSLSP